MNNEYVAPGGSFFILDIKTANQSLTLVKLHALKKKDPGSFQNITIRMLEFDGGDIIMGGDFNFTLNVKLDKQGGNVNNSQTLQNI